MDPEDLIIVDYPSLFEPPAPITSNNLLSNSGTDDYFIKLNIAWEREVKEVNRMNFSDFFWEMKKLRERLHGINLFPNLSELTSTFQLGQSPLQTSLKA